MILDCSFCKLELSVVLYLSTSLVLPRKMVVFKVNHHRVELQTHAEAALTCNLSSSKTGCAMWM